MDLLEDKYRNGNGDHDIDCDPFTTKEAANLRPGVNDGEITG